MVSTTMTLEVLERKAALFKVSPVSSCLLHIKKHFGFKVRLAKSLP